MDPIIGGALLGAGSGLVGDLFNFGQQRANLRYQKGLQREVFAREDTAVQRRVADLRAAGLSPTLAAGSAAASGATIQTQAPQTRAGERAREAVMGALELRALKAGVRKIEAEAGHTEADLRRVEAESTLAAARAGWAGDLASHEVYTKESARYRAAHESETAFQESQLRKFQVQLMRDYGIPEARARTAVAEIDARVRRITEQMGEGGAKSVQQWMPLIQMILEVVGGR